MENPLVSQLVIHSVIVSFSQSFSLSVGQLVSQSVSQLIRQSASLQSMSQSNQSIEVLILHLWICVHCKRQKEGQMEIFKTHNVVNDIHFYSSDPCSDAGESYLSQPEWVWYLCLHPWKGHLRNVPGRWFSWNGWVQVWGRFKGGSGVLVELPTLNLKNI